jgi:rhodanese-related sulfurtransferase
MPIEYCSVEELKNLIDSGESCQIIDVREIPEYQAARIKNSKLTPLSEFMEKINLIEKEKPSYYLCGIGKRALKAAEYLESVGYKDLIVIDGGIKAWVQAGYPVECG